MNERAHILRLMRCHVPPEFLDGGSQASVCACAVEKLTVDELLDGVFLDDSTALPGTNGLKATPQLDSLAGACSSQSLPKRHLLRMPAVPLDNCCPGRLQELLPIQGNQRKASQERSGGERMKVPHSR